MLLLWHGLGTSTVTVATGPSRIGGTPDLLFDRVPEELPSRATDVFDDAPAELTSRRPDVFDSRRPPDLF